ncbi:MAG TPA: Xaa-Pro peptidase family protein [Tepidisphaeraceae bacterium]|jgi:Xaa-Pro aminopeptidase|nr:Xaa-Pro peptidase family protein [Tepidisphaeraceae bacterium]
MLELTHCRSRQRRLLDVIQGVGLDAVVIGDPQHVYYFTGHRPFWQHFAGFVLFSDGRSVLIRSASADKAAAADDIIPYEAAWMCTNRQEQPMLIGSELARALGSRRLRRVCVDASTVCSQLPLMFNGDLIPIDPDLYRLRRVKDPDELAIMRRAIACTKGMYERAREIIEPGISELRVYEELHATAVQIAGEPLSAYLGNDFACGEKGGPPRKDRLAKAGELYLLDLGPAVAGYFSDNCRAFSVDRKITDVQHKAFEIVTGVFPMVENLAKPGVRCRDIFAAVNDYYREKTGRDFPHHLGHGVGLQPHEFPHLNPKWDDTLMEGEVFTCEPGLYAPELKAGIRIENQYLVTKSGVENLTPFGMEME